jgi:hypothetical protein
VLFILAWKTHKHGNSRTYHDLNFAGYYYGCGEIIIWIILDVFGG